ncbi:uncharacterized protein LOC128262283 [Drosophila gunungcola]|uniref:MSP domain-containing protein n=1 Tax=Drosophila gunungcola TaxID=103775 RepID=A0A9Q0BTF3_9MUSC|nr:uncharacterized protein LOC128262283 [Drosophila gunungcola]KAI8043265.1 hypothetical protein M5D96_004592 [Drosophila gunungcola]
MSSVQLIVTPLTLSFQAPLLHPQKRLITLLNPSDKTVIYRIHMTNDTDYSAEPSTGRIEPFDTTELTVTLSPVKEDLPGCLVDVRSIPEDMIDGANEEDWNSSDVKIELDPKKTPRQGDETLRMRLQPQDLAQIFEKHCQPVCTKCTQMCAKSTTSHLWRNRLTYFLVVLGVGLAAYLSYGALLNFKSEPVF